MRKMMVAGNWKMNLNLQQGTELIQSLLAQLPVLDNEKKQVAICPTHLHLSTASALLENRENLFLGAQNCHHEASGAYTGEVSAEMLKSAGVSHVIIGHSERRAYNHESNELLKAKVDAALKAGLQVIFCCGESLETRDAGTQNEFVSEQLAASLFHLTPSEMKNVSIAYEPIWAIGTGRTASSEQAQDMHAHIRSLLRAHYEDTVADRMTILYGGSCKASNAAELFACADVDGGLIGGAALKAEEFVPIVQAMMTAKV